MDSLSWLFPRKNSNDVSGSSHQELPVSRPQTLLVLPLGALLHHRRNNLTLLRWTLDRKSLLVLLENLQVDNQQTRTLGIRRRRASTRRITISRTMASTTTPVRLDFEDPTLDQTQMIPWSRDRLHQRWTSSTGHVIYVVYFEGGRWPWICLLYTSDAADE